MRRKIIGAAVLMAVGLAATAAEVPESTSRRAAATFWNTYRPTEVPRVAADGLKAVALAEMPHLAVYTTEQGFVVMAADDCVQPVLAYSFDSPFPSEQLHASLRYWLRGYEEQIADAARRKVEATASTAAAWTVLTSGEAPDMPLTLTNVPALLTTKWDQSDMSNTYNRLCPYDSTRGEHTVVGCVATAMAQVMKYWNHPSCGTGSHSYVHHGYPDYSVSYGTLSADFAHTTYLWPLMPTSLQFFSTDDQVNAVATLSYHCGVAVDMMYGPSSTGGSGAYVNAWSDDVACTENAMRDYFRYDPSLHGEYRDQYDSLEWATLINTDLENGRPIIYTGDDESGGHCFVLDGSDEAGRYHFNWGWGGYGDGFYAINNLAPGGGGAGGNATYTFNNDQSAIFNVFPVPQQMDTVYRHDTTCNNYDTYDFYEYHLPIEEASYQLVHLDTVFNLDVSVIQRKYMYINPNGGTGQRYSNAFCPADSVELPACRFTREGYRFSGWVMSSNGSGTRYPAGTKMKKPGSFAIYATWVDENDTLAIAEADETLVSLSPNPTASTVSITFPASRAEVAVYDAMGRHVMNNTMHNGEAKIDLSGMPQGLYMVRISTKEGNYNKRVIKQ